MNREENEAAIFARVAALRARLEKAKRDEHQIELHLALSDVELLVGLAEIVAEARKGAAR